MSVADATPAAKRWVEAWPDALAFALGLAVAGWWGWDTTDLVWSLWLASLVVGYAMIVWGAFSPAVVRFREGASGGAATVALISGMAMVAFFTVHFGIFHAVHAACLNMFFPVDGSGEHPGRGLVGEVVSRYGWFVPIAALAERNGFRLESVPPEPPATSVQAADIAARKARQALGWAGYQSPPEGVTQFVQSAPVLEMIRLLVSPFGATILFGTIIFAWLFPLSREKHARIQKLLEQRRARLAE